MKETQKYKAMGTKVSPAMAEVINVICESLGVDVYHLLQQFLYTMVRAASEHHELSPEIQKIMAMMETDIGWQSAFNLCNPDGLEVAQCILILSQKKKKGYGAVMINKPWMGNSTQTECVDEILERVTEVTMKGIYNRLRLVGASMGTRNLNEILLNLIESQLPAIRDEQDKEEMKGRGDIADNGIPYSYGRRTKPYKHHTVDGEFSRQQTIMFGEDDHRQAEMEINDTVDFESMLGFKPFDVEP